MQNSKIFMRLVNIIADIIIIFVIVVTAYVLIQIFFITSFTVPTESMLPEIISGDKVLVDKLSTGARIFDIRNAISGKVKNINRMPHWRTFERNDVLVFNFVHKDSWDSISMNWPTYYIKRCIAVPNDVVEIKDFCYIVNGDTLSKSTDVERIKLTIPEDSICRNMNLNGYMCDVSDTIDRWTIRDLGPLLVPGIGTIVEIDSRTYRRYKQLIEWETGKSVTLKNDIVLLDNAPINKYRFTKNYYFMAGDNIFSSLDSRYLGVIPEEFIVGRAIKIWWSENSNGVQWKRILKNIE